MNDKLEIKNDSNCDQVDLIIRLQQSEANLSCSRNNYFIIITSLLILALSQFKSPNLQLFISILGLVIAITWLLTHHRSSVYTKYWKTKANELSEKLNCPSVYPNIIGGFEIRLILYLLPIAFLLYWSVIIFCILLNPALINPP